MLFYISSLLAIISSFFVIVHSNPFVILYWLILFLFGISGIFFSLGLYFLGAMEIIINIGAIMILFLFIVMLLNPKEEVNKVIEKYFSYNFLRIYVLILLILFITVIFCFLKNSNDCIIFNLLNPKIIGIFLFKKYPLIVEYLSLLLLLSFIICCNIMNLKKKFMFLNKKL